MLMKTKKTILLLLVLVCCLLLCACESTVNIGGEKYSTDLTELTVQLQEGETSLLEDFPALQRVDLSGSTCYEEIAEWAAKHPDVDMIFRVMLPDGTEVDHDVKTLDLSDMGDAYIAAARPLLVAFPHLKTVKLGSEKENDLLPKTVLAFLDEYPEIDFDYSFSCQGKPTSIRAKSLDFSEKGKLSDLLPWLSCMKDLKKIDLGSDDAENSRFSWKDIAKLEKAAPKLQLDYSFTLYGEEFTLQDTSMDLNHITIEDEGKLVQEITACMPNLNYLDMDFCGVSDERMAEIRDALPKAEVVWRIWFGKNYTARTNTERILASNPGRGGELTAENTQSLKYCTKVKCIDVGHNILLNDISFVSYMPELETAVLAMNCWRDLKPLLNCPNLEYLEMQTGACSDLRPLAQLKKLKHLNVCYCFALSDLSPIYDLDLERLWIGCVTPIPAEQVEEYQHLHPKCKINTETLDPTEDGWRYLGYNEFGMQTLDPRYALLRKQFEYSESQDSYNYIENDPLYRKGGWW